MKFYCSDCKLDFEDIKPIKKDYRDYILGPCWKHVSNCPKCGQETDEKIIPKPQKITSSFPQNSCSGDCERCG